MRVRRKGWQHPFRSYEDDASSSPADDALSSTPPRLLPIVYRRGDDQGISPAPDSSKQAKKGSGARSSSGERKLSGTNQSLGSYGLSNSSDSAHVAGDKSEATSLSSSLSDHAGWWFEEEKAFPLKKRKNSLRRFTAQERWPREERKRNYNYRNEGCGGEELDGIAEEASGWRCTRNRSSGWRCSRKRMEGRAFCEYHVMKRLCVDQKKDWGLDKEENVHCVNGKFCKRKGTRMVMISSLLDRRAPSSFGETVQDSTF